MSVLILLVNTIPEILATAIRWEKETTDIQIGNEEVKFSLFTDNIIIYVENPIESTKNKTQLSNNMWV